jgi:hypothetical protein
MSGLIMPTIFMKQQSAWMLNEMRPLVLRWHITHCGTEQSINQLILFERTIPPCATQWQAVKYE